MTTTYDAEIEQVTQSVFSTMLGIELVRIEDCREMGTDNLVASIQITGDWVGGVILSFSQSVANAATSILLQMETEDITPSDREDVAGELVNMVGGNLKSLLPGSSSLSLPTVISGREFEIRTHHAELIDDVLLGAECGNVRVRLFAQISS